MLKNTILNSDYFWETLSFVESSQDDHIYVESLLKELNLTEDQLLEFITFVNLFNFNLRLEKTMDGARLLRIPNPKPTITISLTFSQWLGLQTQMPKLRRTLEKSPKMILKNLEEKVNDVQEQHPQFNYFRVIEEEREKQKIFFKICNQNRTILEKIEDGVSNNLCLHLSLKEGKQIEIFIHQVVFLDGGLSVVAEDIYEKCLVYFDLNSISVINLSFTSDYKPTYSSIEINDFISSVRSVIGTEDRLVLKIKNQEKVSLSPAYHFLGNPFITSNMNGDIIWAASVERSEQLYRWLDEIFDHVEILDPQNLKEEYFNYRNGSLKKAS